MPIDRVDEVKADVPANPFEHSHGRFGLFHGFGSITPITTLIPFIGYHTAMFVSTPFSALEG
jgi:hypothetical protein